MSKYLAEIIIGMLVVALVFGCVYAVKNAFKGGGTGSPGNVFFGAAEGLMSHDQRKAMEIIVKQQEGEMEQEDEAGEGDDLLC